MFQGRFKAIHVDSNEYLLHLSAYVNLNDVAHARGNRRAFSMSSWNEYTTDFTDQICEKSVILEQFKNKKDYKKFAEETLRDIIKRKILVAEIEGSAMSIPGVDKGGYGQ